MLGPEDKSREKIDEALEKAGWNVQDTRAANLSAGRGIALRNFPLASGHGFADYLLYIDGKAAGVVEAKKEGFPLVGVEPQSARYSEGLPATLPAYLRPLPFLYQSTGIETRFTNRLDPEPRSRRTFSFHRPASLAVWLETAGVQRTIDRDDMAALKQASYSIDATLRSRLKRLAVNHPLKTEGLWPAQITAINNLEQSLAEDRPRALIQMATGSGKTFTAINFIYRLI
jgi:type I restriction enzyme R subunit